LAVCLSAANTHDSLLLEQVIDAAWLVGYRRLQLRYERRADVLLGFPWLACALLCLKSLNQPKV
jgi:hypothetical protein